MKRETESERDGGEKERGGRASAHGKGYLGLAFEVQEGELEVTLI